MTLTRNFAIKKDKDVDEARSAIFGKNHQIGELFNKQQEMEREFETRFTQMKQA